MDGLSQLGHERRKPAAARDPAERRQSRHLYHVPDGGSRHQSPARGRRLAHQHQSRARRRPARARLKLASKTRKSVFGRRPAPNFFRGGGAPEITPARDNSAGSASSASRSSAARPAAAPERSPARRRPARSISPLFPAPNPASAPGSAAAGWSRS